MSQLNELLGPTRKAVIYNGKLLLWGNRPIYVREEKRVGKGFGGSNSRLIFTVSVRNNKSGGSKELNLTDGIPGSAEEGEELKVFDESVLMDLLLLFDKQYASVWLREPETITVENADISAVIDNFTGALVLESGLYRRSMDQREFHSIDRSYSPEARALRANLLLEYIDNYFDIYHYLFHKRIGGQSAPLKTRGHLTSGFFQPIKCFTSTIRDPLTYPVLSSIDAFMRGNHPAVGDNIGNIETVLEDATEQRRRVNLVCASTYDICMRFFPRGDDPEASLAVPTMMDRRHFMFIYLTLLSYAVQDLWGLNIPLEQLPIQLPHIYRTNYSRIVKANPALNGLMHNMIARFEEIKVGGLSVR